MFGFVDLIFRIFFFFFPTDISKNFLFLSFYALRLFCKDNSWLGNANLFFLKRVFYYVILISSDTLFSSG